MKTIGLLFVALYCLSSPAQTNSMPEAQDPPSRQFPEVPLLTLAAEPKPAQPPATTNRLTLLLEMPPPEREKTLLDDFPTTSTGAPHEATSLDSEQAIMLRYYERLELGGYLTRPEPPSDSRLLYVVEPIFQPEPIQVGRTIVSCPIITAIKRKNPLALLNPLVLNVSW
jgi:hypothetical protein